jgi:hypothetical protein
MDTTILVSLGVLSLTSAYVLFYPSRKIYQNYHDFKLQGEHKEALKNLNEQSVEEAIQRAKDDFSSKGIVEEYSLIRAKTARGFSIAEYNHKGWFGKESLSKIVKH